MSAEFEELMKARDNPSEEAQSKSKCRRSLLFYSQFLQYCLYQRGGDERDFCFSSDLVEFTDEEGYGRYLDLHDCYLKYINLKGVEVAIPFQSVLCVFLFEILCCNSYFILSLYRNWSTSHTCPHSTSSLTSPRTGRMLNIRSRSPISPRF